MEKFFVSRPIFAISLAIVIVLVGLISIMGLPIEQYPDITPPVVEVSASEAEHPAGPVTCGVFFHAPPAQSPGHAPDAAMGTSARESVPAESGYFSDT